MKIKYLAHASFLITASNGTRIITDPYKTGDGFKYAPIIEEADIVTISHEHGDHNYTATIGGKPVIVRTSGTYHGIKIKAVPTAHDNKGGKQRGANTIFVMQIDSINVAHLGDLGHTLNTEQITDIGQVDVLMLPVGGFFTIDADMADTIARQLKAKIIIPMHYKTPKCDLPISGVEAFISGKNNVKRSGVSEIMVSHKEVPSSPQIIVLEPSH